MPISIEISPPMAGRPCRFSFCLQGGSVFADFDVDEEGHVFLRRISFDGYGCCDAPDTLGRVPLDHSHALLDRIEREAVHDPAVESILRTYFRENADFLWRDALADHGLL